jgi:hypothetical protein
MAKVTTPQVIEAIRENKGFITQAAKSLGISRRHLHRLINRHPTIKEAVEDAKEEMKDFTESKLYQGINDGNPTLIIFHLKTQAKDRGYIERQEIDHSGAVKIEVIYGDRDGKSETAPPKTDRRSGKTTGVAILAVEQFLSGHRILYATPTQEQVDTFWRETKEALSEPIEAGAFYKNETLHTIERRGSDQRIRAKTAWDADSLRGDFADILILDEFQDMDVEAWTLVGAPMLLDNNGDAIFIYTKKRGRNHTNDLFKRALADETGRWATFIFTSFDNPYISEEALADITDDMTNLGYRMEILAEDIGDDPRALWNRGIIRHVSEIPTFDRVVVGVDPSGAASGDECGIVTVGRGMLDGQRCAFVLGDDSRTDTAAGWGAAVVAAYNRHKAGRVVGEANYGGRPEYFLQIGEGYARESRSRRAGDGAL